MRNFGLVGGRQSPGGKSALPPALHDEHDYTSSAQFLVSEIPAGAIFERGDVSQMLFDIACALVWMLLGVVSLVGIGVCILVPLFLAFD